MADITGLLCICHISVEFLNRVIRISALGQALEERLSLRQSGAGSAPRASAQQLYNAVNAQTAVASVQVCITFCRCSARLGVFVNSCSSAAYTGRDILCNPCCR